MSQPNLAALRAVADRLGAAQRDPALYDLLALVDAMRFGRARERALAEKEITDRLNAHVAA